MHITFQTQDGARYSAEKVGDKLLDITLIDSPPPSGGSAPSRGGGGTEPAQGESAPADGESKESNANNGGATQEPPIPEDRVFIEQLQAVLVNNRARKQLRNKQKGSLDLKALVRTQTNSQSVFKQNNRKDSMRNYSVMILVDESGSMGGSKTELAQELVANISRNLDRVGGVETAVVGFSGNRLVEHKRFDNTGTNSVRCISSLTGSHNRHSCSTCSRINYVQDSDGQNADLIAMEYSLDYLMRNQAHGSKPIFVMLSDGSPCGSSRDIEVVTADLKGKTFTSKLIKRDTNTRDISTMHRLLALYPEVNAFGLGMLEGGQQVPKHKVVRDIKQTKGVLLDFLRTSIS